MYFTTLIICLLVAGPMVIGDFHGPTYPAPKDLSTKASHVRIAWENVTATFDAYLQHGVNSSATIGIVGTENVTFSAGLFSVHDIAAAQLQYHYTAPQVATSENGTHAVDGDSIYRTASITKLMTVLAGLLSLTDEQWHQSILETVPELAGQASENAPDWSHITPWTLATHLSGLPAIGALSDIFYSLEAGAIDAGLPLRDFLMASGLPLANTSSVTPCTNGVCTLQDFVVSLGSTAPVLLPNATPAYSNLGMMILGLIIGRLSNKSYDVLYNDTVFTPLGMQSTFINAPLDTASIDRSVITGPWEGSWVFPDNFFTVPSGGVLSTINDLSRLGIGILNSTLMSRDDTRVWMKPHSHTASFSYSIGAPWEIVRYVHKTTGKITDLYTKLGDSGAYGGILVLIPDYDAGFSLLNAYYTELSPPRGELALQLINQIAETIIPALEAQAAEEATMNYVGTYVSTDPTVNSSLMVAFNQSSIPTSASGLSVQSFVSLGVDMLGTWFENEKPRLLLAIPKESPGTGKVVFQISVNPQWNSYEAAGSGPFTGFYQTNFDFALYDGVRYAGGGLHTFTFEVDDQGHAVSVLNGATRLVMKKQE